jgi:hypothetical protein
MYIVPMCPRERWKVTVFFDKRILINLSRRNKNKMSTNTVRIIARVRRKEFVGLGTYSNFVYFFACSWSGYRWSQEPVRPLIFYEDDILPFFLIFFYIFFALLYHTVDAV